MAAALVPLQNITLGSAQSSVVFGSIPTTGYRDLRLVVRTSTTSAFAYILVRLNADSGANYSYVVAQEYNGSASSNTYNASTGLQIGGDGRTSSGAAGIFTFDLFDYNQTDKHKSSLSRSAVAGSTYPGTAMVANRWANTAAVTSLTVVPNTGNLEAGSTFALYGVVA